MQLHPDVAGPADAGAVVVTPSLVSDRYVQLAPVHTGGPTLADGDLIPTERTAVPLEVDEVFESVDELATALGPDGVNSEGALSEFLTATAGNLDGNGAKLGEAIRELGKASQVLGESADDFFGAIDHLSVFTEMLATNDSQLRRLDAEIGPLTRFFAEEREDLGDALAELGKALGTVEGFVRDNRAEVTSTVERLDVTAKTLAEQKNSLGEALERAPAALRELLRAYDPDAGTIDVRPNLNEFSFDDPAKPRVPLPLGGGG
jgi:virulence factor Mce-like protein